MTISAWAADYAQLLLQEKVFQYQAQKQFTWTSGLIMPFYCDQRLLLSYVHARKKIIQLLVNFYQSANLPLQNIALVGIATAGISWAALLAHELNLPMAYVRPQKKEHGQKKSLEGDLPPGTEIILVEDLVSTAKSLSAAAQILRAENYHINKVLTLFTYELLLAQKALEENKLELFALSSFASLYPMVKNELQFSATQINYFAPHLSGLFHAPSL